MTCGYYEYVTGLAVLAILMAVACAIVWWSPQAMTALAKLLLRRALALKLAREKYHLSWNSSSTSNACLDLPDYLVDPSDWVLTEGTNDARSNS